MLKYTSLTLSRGYNIEKGREGRNVNIGDQELTRSMKQVIFGECQLLLSMTVVVFKNKTSNTVYSGHNYYLCVLMKAFNSFAL